METIIYKDGDKYLLKNKILSNYDIYIDLNNGNITNFWLNSSPCNRAIIRKTKEEIIKILNIISEYELKFEFYWYSTISDATDISELNPHYIKYLMEDIEHHLPKSVYLKLKSESTYCIRFDIDYDTVKEDKKDTIIKEDKNKGENNMKNSFKDFIKCEEIEVKMEWQTGQLVLDDEGHYFLDGIIMQTLPEMTIKMPAYIMSTPISSLSAGDIVSYKGDYIYIDIIKNNKIKGIKLSGEEINFSVPTHVFLGNNLQMLPKVFSPFSMNGKNNMSVGQGIFNFNPAMLYVFNDNDDGDFIKQMMKFNMMNNMGIMFGQNMQNLNRANVAENIEDAKKEAGSGERGNIE